VCVFLVLAVLVVFGQTARFKFVNFDDDLNVYENSVVQKGLSAHAVAWAFSHEQVFNWVPLTTLSHMLDCQIFGQHAGGHHAVNVLLHAANAVLLFLVLRRMTGSLWRSAFVAAVFAVHPLRAESVAWVTERKDVLSGLFFMLAIRAYVNYVGKWRASSLASSFGKSTEVGKAAEDVESRKQKLFYALTLVFFALGLLAKSMVATLPFVLLLLDFWPLNRMPNAECRMQNSDGGEQRDRSLPFWSLVREKIPLFLLSAGACVAAALAPGLVITDAHRLPLLERIANALVSYVIYARQMVFPAGLAVVYPYTPGGEPMWKACAALVVLAGISAGVVACRKKRPWLLTGWLWYLGMLLPVIGVVQISYDATHSDRYTYLPGIGLSIAGAWAVWDWGKRWGQRPGIWGDLMLAVIVLLAYLGCIQTSYWKESQTLWTHALNCTTGNSLAHYSLGMAFLDKGEKEEAIQQFRNALEIKPDYAEVRNNLGHALFDQGEKEEAIAQYRKAIEIKPDYVKARYNLGYALAKEGLTEEAIAQYRKAVEIEPDFVMARNNLGVALDQHGDTEEAIAQYRKVLEITPDNAVALNNLGLALARKGQVDEAILSYRHAIKINPKYADAYGNLGLALAQKGETRQAIESWQQSLAIKPDQPSVQNNLAWLLATASDASLRDGAEAVALAEQARLSTGGGNAVFLRTLAAAYAEAGRYADATAAARRSLELSVAQTNHDLTAKLPKEIKLFEENKPMRDAAQ